MSWLRKAVREPLLQFLLAGALLLLVQHFLAPRPPPLSAQIIVPATQLQDLRASFREVYGREPDAKELTALAQRSIDDEVLYRQALALGLDRADPIVRRELQQKMRFLLEDTTPVAEPSEAELQQWLDDHPQAYGHPATTSFAQVYVSRAQRGVSVDQRVQQIVTQLHAHPDIYSALGDPLPGGNDWRDQSDIDLRRSFGEAFAQALPALPLAQWSAPIASALGTHLVRVSARTPLRAATLDEVRQRVLVDCRQARRDAANRRALDALRSRYQIQFAPETP